MDVLIKVRQVDEAYDEAVDLCTTPIDKLDEAVKTIKRHGLLGDHEVTGQFVDGGVDGAYYEIVYTL